MAEFVGGYHGFTMSRVSLSFRYVACILFAFVALVPLALAKDAPLQTIDWPDTGSPVLRFTFSKFKQLPGMGSLHGYVMDTTAQNLSSRVIPSARFTVYLLDKNKVRVGEDVIAVNNVGPGETVKFETTVAVSGQPVSIALHEIAASAKAVSMTVNSTPQGAMLSVDGTQAGTTPRMITVGPGHHTLNFTKEGFNAGTFPLDISPNDVSGGTVSFELGAASYDSIELRDGTVLTGDLVSVSGMDVEIRVGGAIQHLDRNKVKRVMFVTREAPKPDPIAPQSN